LVDSKIDLSKVRFVPGAAVLADWHRIRPECRKSRRERPPQLESLASQGRLAATRRDGAPTAVLANVRAWPGMAWNWRTWECVECILKLLQLRIWNKKLVLATIDDIQIHMKKPVKHQTEDWAITE